MEVAVLAAVGGSNLVGAVIERLTGRLTRSRGEGSPELEGLFRPFVVEEMKKVEKTFRELGELPPDLLHEHVKLWAHKAMDLPYRIEDVMYDCVKHPSLIRHGTAAMEEIEKLTDEVIESHRRYMADARDSPVKVTLDPRLSMSYYKHSTQLVGIDEACSELIKMLTEVSDEATKQQMETFSIVGFAGLGKTSLAKMVYQKLEVLFDCAAFVSVSPKPNMEEIFCDMLHQLERKGNDRCTYQVTSHQKQLAEETRNFLHNKRYLIVIDDLWNIKDWDIIRRTLPNNACGSRVITTTRISDVAKICCSDRDELIYDMKNLGDLYSKRLFLKEFIGSEDCCSDALTEVVDDILKICGGMPLAIVSTASVLASKVDAKEPLQEMANSLQSIWKEMLSYLNTGHEQISGLENLRKIISLSYFHLPSRAVQACFLYLASCSKSHKIERHEWVKKWISEGLIPQDEGLHTSEEVASRYFDELINCNVIQPVEYYDDCIGRETYEIPYMMLYILRLISHEYHFVTFVSDNDMSHSDPHERTARRLSIQCCADSESYSIGTDDLSHVRSLTIHGFAKSVLCKRLDHLHALDIDGCNDLDNTIMEKICRMTLLKHLSLKKTHITALPPKVGELKRLEDLDVSQTQIAALPPEIGYLERLNTLGVSRTQITALPREIGNLMSLIALDVSRTQITALPREIGNLTSLTALDVSRTQITALPREIGNLTFLKTLDVSRTQITSLPREIGNLMFLKTLDVSRTQITSVPREIGDLMYLETLDARSTSLKELPKEVVRPMRLRNLLFGQSSFHGGVKLPAGCNQLWSVKVLSAVDSRECSASILEELSELEELDDLTVVLHDGPDDKEKNDNLVASIGKIPHLKSLTIYGDSHWTDDHFPEQDPNSSDNPPASCCFPALEKLKVAGRFVRVPGWFAQLTVVTILEIRICRLDEDKDLEILGKMTNLRNLVLSLIVALPRKQLTIGSSVEFAKLEVFTFDCRAPWVSFEQGAMRRLKHLQLRLYAGPEGRTPSGIIHLANLTKVSLRYFSQYAGSVCIRQTIDAMKKEAANHPNLIRLFVNGTQEIFPFNRSVILYNTPAGPGVTECIKVNQDLIRKTRAH